MIPLGALLPVRVENLIPACKNIGTTHVTNGCYRLHPVEWNIGEAAGVEPVKRGRRTQPTGLTIGAATNAEALMRRWWRRRESNPRQ